MTIGIVEWARRTEGARACELAAAGALGRHVASTTDLRARLALVGRARRHAWRATQWEAVVPVLHDVTVDETAAADPAIAHPLAHLVDAPDAETALVADRALVASVATRWQRWCDEAGPVADVPYLRAAERSLADVAAQGL